jgi:hypothetical protein
VSIRAAQNEAALTIEVVEDSAKGMILEEQSRLNLAWAFKQRTSG